MQINQSTNLIPQYQRQQSNPNFTSKKDIKAADDICRMVMREFPVYSSSRMTRLPHKRSESLYKIYSFADALVSEIRGFCSFAKSPADFYLRKLGAIKQYRAGNCAELSDITALSFKLNGYKNVDAYSIYAYNDATGMVRELDHAIVGINVTRPIPKPENSDFEFFLPDRNTIIADPWAGFVDHACNALPTYGKDKTFSSLLKPDEVIVLCQNKNISLDDCLSRKDRLFIRHKYPELCKSKKFSLIDRILWYFMDKKPYETEQISIGAREAVRRNLKMKAAISQEELTRILNSGVG